MNLRKQIVEVVLVLIVALAGPAIAAQKVIVVSGVSETSAANAGTYQMVFDGIKEGLQTGGIVPEFQFVDLGVLSEAAKESTGTEAAAKIVAAKPDLVISLNDDCLKHIGSKIDTIPVVFAWIWSKPETLGMPKSNITGVTRQSYATDIWSMARKLTGADNVALLSRNSSSMAGVKQYLSAGADKLAQASGVKFMDMYLLDSFAEWTEKVHHFPAKLMYLADTSRLMNDGVEMKDADLVAWTVANAKVPVIAAAEKDVKAGALFAIVTSEKAIGVSAAEIALKILAGAKPADIPYVASAKGKLVINGKTAQKSNITIPYEILATAEKIYE